MCVSLFSILLFSFVLHAAEVGEPTAPAYDGKITKRPSTDPKCLTNVKLNKKKRIVYESVPRSMNRAELVARLVYAETMAANCGKHNDEIMQPIAEVIDNRIRAFKLKKDSEPEAHTVFGQSQFASSLHHYPQARQEDFLCPKDMMLFARVRSLVEGFATGNFSKKNPEATHYFLHKHYGKYADPKWAKAESVGKFGDDCVELYKVDNAFLDKPYKGLN